MLFPAGMRPNPLDEERIVMDLIEAWFNPPGYPVVVYTGTETIPGRDFEASLPFVRVGRVGGAPDGPDDHPVVDIDVLSKTRAEAKDIANTIMALLESKPHPINEINVLMAPQKVNWIEGSPIRRFYASYHLTFRRPSA